MLQMCSRQQDRKTVLGTQMHSHENQKRRQRDAASLHPNCVELRLDKKPWAPLLRTRARKRLISNSKISEDLKPFQLLPGKFTSRLPKPRNTAPPLFPLGL